MKEVATVVLGVDSPALAEEVMHFLDRTGTARVVATTSDQAALARAIRERSPHVVVGHPDLVAGDALNGSVFLALDTGESIRSLRCALEAGARGFYVWPEDRAALASAAAIAVPQSPDQRARHGGLIAVTGARGGAGATFVSVHLARAVSALGHRTALVDAALGNGCVLDATGLSHGADRSVGDLVPVIDELAPEHVGEVLLTHPSGFHVLGQAPDDRAPRLSPPQVGSVIQATRRICDVVVIDVPKGSEAVWERLPDASAVLVLNLDVASFRAGRRLVEDLVGESGQSCSLVVNRARRGEIVVRDVERVFGKPPVVVLPEHRSVPRVQDRGQLLSSRGPMGRRFNRLARHLGATLSEGRE